MHTPKKGMVIKMILLKICRYDRLPDEETAMRKVGEAAPALVAGKKGRARIESLLGYGLLRELLGNEFSPARLRKEANGRPYLEESTVDFSISHTEGMAVCAVEKGVEAPRIGVDAETLRGRTRAETERIAARWFTEAERKKFSQTPSEETFLSIWTAKEAMAKFIGTGLCGIGKLETAVEPVRTPDGTPVVLSEERIGDTVLTVCVRDRGAESKNIKKFS